MRGKYGWVCGVLLCLLQPLAPDAAQSDTLPRRTGSQDESYAQVTVRYASVRDSAGERLRLILTYPQGAGGPWPLIFVTGWLSCDSIEAPPGTREAPQLMFQSLARLPGFATARLEKPGVGDSEGDCGRTDFQAELDAYRQAFREVSAYPFVDRERVFLFGLSNGAGFAPLVPQGAPVRGYLVIGGWIKTWFEHMLEIERRRLSLAGRGAAQLNPLMQQVEELYSAYLLRGEAPERIFAQHPELGQLWEGPPEQQYGRPIAYYQQLQQLNLMQAWSQVHAPLLALHGEYDWIMSRADLELMAALGNAQRPGAAQFLELPGTGHTFEHYASQQQAFSGHQQRFDPALARLVGEWLQRHR